nr:ferritin family protein [uncultured Holophaga sp.]
MSREFSDLSDRDILALAISLEEEDGRIYGDLAEALKDNYPATADVFRRMRDEESGHRHRLLTLYQQRFGDHIPLMRRQDVKGFVERRNFWTGQGIHPETARRQAETMEFETRRFYETAARRTTDARTRQLLGDLAAIEEAHIDAFAAVSDEHLDSDTLGEEERTRKRLFVLQVIQPGLAGLMDGSVSTLAPIFAAAFATRNSHDAMLVGLAASVGAGISMGFAEALSDDGSLSGRGRPYVRGIVCGLMTTVGGIFHTLPYLIHSFRAATTLAVAVVVVELFVIAWIRKRYMDTPFLSAAFQVVVGGVLVFLAGVLIGGA